MFGHGNGEVVDYWVNELDGFRNRGIGVLLVEYPGYGRSSGSTSEASIRAAIFASRFLAPSFSLRDHFDNEAALRQFPGPVLVIHGRADTLIPWQQGRRLASASPRSTFRLYDCGHGCWDPDHLPFWRDVDALLSGAGVR